MLAKIRFFLLFFGKSGENIVDGPGFAHRKPLNVLNLNLNVEIILLNSPTIGRLSELIFCIAGAMQNMRRL